MKRAAISPRFRATMVVLLLLLANGAAVHWCWTTYRDMGLLNIAWTRTSKVSIEKATYLAQIERTIGYGEFIHNFKNYVLRRTPKYEEGTKASLEKVSHAIQTMRSLPLQAEDRDDLLVISQTVAAYRKNFERAQAGDWRALSPHELDELVYVDDGPAVAAFTGMRDRILPVFMSQVRAHERELDAIWREVAAGAFLVIPLIFVNCLLCIWGGMKLLRRRESDIVIFEGSSDAILVCDENGEILRTNRIAEHMFEYSEGELRHRRMVDLIPDMAPLFGGGPPEEEALKGFAQRADGKLLARTKVGRVLPVSISVSSLLFFRQAAKMVVVREAS